MRDLFVLPFSALHQDKEEEEALRLAKLLEEEKAQFSVRMKDLYLF